MIKKILYFFISGTVLLSSCSSTIPVQKDTQLGQITVNKIRKDPKNYPILSSAEYPQAYAEMERIVQVIISSPEIEYRDIFAYDSITILHDDKNINAFCTPGGYVFVYTGLIKNAQNEDQLAAVLAHEIAHAERRHSVKKVTKGVGRQAVIIAAAVATGATFGAFIAVEVANKILGLGLSRNKESEADKYSVMYLQSTGEYKCTALADFFKELVVEGNDVHIPTIISSHPNTRERILKITRMGSKLGCENDVLRPHPGFEILQTSIPE
jgi:predicted Zn-dependent protease